MAVVEVDTALLQEAMRVTGITDPGELVERALRQMIEARRMQRRIREMREQIVWQDDPPQPSFAKPAGGRFMILYELVGADLSRPFSPHCWKARMALRHKGFEPERRGVPFTQVPAVEGGTSRIVPVLRDGETVVADSFAIAEYLERTYPDRPSLFGGEGGRALSRFVEAWSQNTVHPVVTRTAVHDIHEMLGERNRGYFRESRETMLGAALEEVQRGREERVAAFRTTGLKPLEVLLGRQDFLGGEGPLFADHIVFGVFQWARVVTPVRILPEEGPVAAWFERCLDLYGGERRSVSPASLAA